MVLLTESKYMTTQELYEVLTLKSDWVPPEDVYYQKLGRVLREMRVAQGISSQEIARNLNIRPDELRGYEDGICEIPVYKLLLLVGYIENPNE